MYGIDRIACGELLMQNSDSLCSMINFHESSILTTALTFTKRREHHLGTQHIAWNEHFGMQSGPHPYVISLCKHDSNIKLMFEHCLVITEVSKYLTVY